MDSSSSHIDQIADMLAAPPPRQVPPDLRRSAMRQSGSMVLMIVGVAVTIFALIFSLAFFPWDIARQSKFDAADLIAQPGKIVEVQRTNLSINNSPVMRFTFEYHPSQSGDVVRAMCFTTGRRWSVGADVTVRYDPKDPGLACIEGARLTQTGAAAAFILLFPCLGLILIAIGFTFRKRTQRLLTHGQVTEAIVIKINGTSTRINNQTVFKIVLKRIDRADDSPIEIRKHQPDIVSFARDRLASKLPVFVLFDPQYPRRALLPEML